MEGVLAEHHDTAEQKMRFCMRLDGQASMIKDLQTAGSFPSYELVKLGCSDYRESWKFHPPEKEQEDPEHMEQQKILEDDLAFVARGSAEHIKPYLQRLYAIRVATLQAAGQQFVSGYKEGLEKANADTVINSLAEAFWDKSKKASNGDQKMESRSHADSRPHDNVTSPASVLQGIHKQDNPP